jgi:hypothetical protein
MMGPPAAVIRPVWQRHYTVRHADRRHCLLADAAITLTRRI